MLWKCFYLRASLLQRKRVFSITSYWLVFSALCCDVSSSLKMCWHIRACGLLLSHDSISCVEACQKLVIFHLQRGRDWDQSPLVVDVGANVSFISLRSHVSPCLSPSIQRSRILSPLLEQGWILFLSRSFPWLSRRRNGACGPHDAVNMHGTARPHHQPLRSQSSVFGFAFLLRC